MHTPLEPQLSSGVEGAADPCVASWGFINAPVTAVPGQNDDSCPPTFSLPSQGWIDLTIQFDSFLPFLLAAPTRRCERKVFCG